MARPVEEFGGGTATKPSPNPIIPVAPKPRRRPKPTVSRTPLGRPAPKAKRAKTKPLGGGKDDVSGAERRAVQRENEAKRKAADRYMKQVANLDIQANALKRALNHDFARSRDRLLADISQALRQQQDIIRTGFVGRYDQLETSAEDNEKATSAQTGINTRNMIRERANAIDAAIAQGAGESDVLRTQLMSLRNWNANQNEIDRAYSDTLQSINSSLTDLEIDTRTALANNVLQANSDKGQVWQNYHDRRSEAFTNLGNIRGQQADYVAQAVEMDAELGRARNPRKKALSKWEKGRPVGSAGKGHAIQDRKRAKARRQDPVGRSVDTLREARRGSREAFMAASRETGRTWNSPGIPKQIQNWDGKPEFEERDNPLSRYQTAKTVSLGKRPEGATLRKW